MDRFRFQPVLCGLIFLVSVCGATTLNIDSLNTARGIKARHFFGGSDSSFAAHIADSSKKNDAMGQATKTVDSALGAGFASSGQFAFYTSAYQLSTMGMGYSRGVITIPTSDTLDCWEMKNIGVRGLTLLSSGYPYGVSWSPNGSIYSVFNYDSDSLDIAAGTDGTVGNDYINFLVYSGTVGDNIKAFSLHQDGAALNVPLYAGPIIADSLNVGGTVIQENGNVGIGTTSFSNAALWVQSGSQDVVCINGTSGDGLRLYRNSASDWRIDHASNNLQFHRLQGTGSYIFNDANVGIGTTSPTRGKLDVSGSIASDSVYSSKGIKATTGAFSSTVTADSINSRAMKNLKADSLNVGGTVIRNNGNLSITGSTPNNIIKWKRDVCPRTWGFTVDNSGTYFYNETDGITPMTFLNGGYVGIGTTSPDQALVVAGYTRLGSLSSPAIKTLTLTGTAAASDSSYVNIVHNLTASKILAVNILIQANAGTLNGCLISPGVESPYQYEYWINGTYIVVKTISGAGIHGAAITILVTYSA